MRFMTLTVTDVYTIWQQGSFYRAAEKLYLTQPALSMDIRKIEKALGMPLFDRKCHPLKLTDAGKKPSGHGAQGAAVGAGTAEAAGYPESGHRYDPSGRRPLSKNLHPAGAIGGL